MAVLLSVLLLQSAIPLLPPQVTLHNSALINMDSDPTGGFKKLNFLLQSPPFPPETFANLLLLYCKPTHGFYDLAADVLAENPQYASKFLSQVRLPHAYACIYSMAGRAARGPQARAARAPG